AIRDILVTRRHRKPGSRITHPYSRLTAIPIIFDEVRRKLEVSREYYEYKRRCVYCDIVRQEVADGARVIMLTTHFVALVPYASRSPFGVWFWRGRQEAAYEPPLSPDVIPALAALLEGYFRTLVSRLGDPPFEMTLYTCPNQGAKVLAGEWSTIAEDY